MGDLLRALTIAAGIAGLGSAAAAATIAGGELDPAITDSEIYVGVPKSAAVPPGAACRVTQAYVDHINAGEYAQVVDLFAEDAVLLEPVGRGARGRSQIARFYQGHIGAMRPHVIAVSYVGSPSECMVALAVRVSIGGAARYRLASVDHFTLDAQGKVASMVAFSRQGSRPPVMPSPATGAPGPQ